MQLVVCNCFGDADTEQLNHSLTILLVSPNSKKSKRYGDDRQFVLTLLRTCSVLCTESEQKYQYKLGK